jgi:hypothetical protein
MKLFFCELARYHWASTMAYYFERALAFYGWSRLDFPDVMANNPDASVSADEDGFVRDWYDTNHPRAELALKLVRDLLAQTKLAPASRVLLLGDSTTAYCVDTQQELSARAFETAILIETGYHLTFFPVSGSRFESTWKIVDGVWVMTGFSERARVAMAAQQFDAVLLVGGWNQWEIPAGWSISGMVSRLTDIFV